MSPSNVDNEATSTHGNSNTHKRLRSDDSYDDNDHHVANEDNKKAKTDETNGNVDIGINEDKEELEKQRERRLAMNRMSARDRRKRKRQLIEDLQKKIESETRENEKLRSTTDSLRSQIDKLKDALISKSTGGGVGGAQQSQSVALLQSNASMPVPAAPISSAFLRSAFDLRLAHHQQQQQRVPSSVSPFGRNPAGPLLLIPSKTPTTAGHLLSLRPQIQATSTSSLPGIQQQILLKKQQQEKK